MINNNNTDLIECLSSHLCVLLIESSQKYETKAKLALKVCFKCSLLWLLWTLLKYHHLVLYFNNGNNVSFDASFGADFILFICPHDA